MWTTLAFAFGTALAFGIVYFLVAKGIRERSDTWLRGEAEVLAEVSASTPKDRLYDRIVEEVAELASEEVAAGRNSKGKRLNSVFFLQTDPDAGRRCGWVPARRMPFWRCFGRPGLFPTRHNRLT